MSIPTRQVSNSQPQGPTPEERLLEYVEAQVENFRKYSNLGDPQGMPGYYELNEALMNYSNVNCSLISLDVIAKQEYERAKNAFDDFMAEKYMIERAKLNPTSLSANKWASAKEIEYMVKNDYYDEYSKLYSEMTAAEMKVAACRRFLNAWESHLYCIRQLCKNTEIETIRLGASGGEI